MLRHPRHHRQARSVDAGGGRLSPATPPLPELPNLPREAGMKHYVREAFLFRWNLLLFAGGVAAAALTPLAPVLLPLVAAGELTYLTGLVSIPRFRAAIDAKAHAAGKASTGVIGPVPPPASLVS